MPLAKKINKKYTRRDYLKWPDDERWEIIDGEACNMSPAPSTRHQRVGWNIKTVFIQNKEKLKDCIPFDAPADVVFDEYNVVQPDIFIVCDKTLIKEQYIQGAPDLIIEIISPNTELRDRREKKKLYELFGIKEYILVNPDREYVERYVMENDKYSAPEIFNWDERLKLTTFDMELNLWEIFEKELPEEGKNAPR